MRLSVTPSTAVRLVPPPAPAPLPDTRTDKLVRWMAAHPWAVCAVLCACILAPALIEVPR